MRESLSGIGHHQRRQNIGVPRLIAYGLIGSIVQIRNGSRRAWQSVSRSILSAPNVRSDVERTKEQDAGAIESRMRKQKIGSNRGDARGNPLAGSGGGIWKIGRCVPGDRDKPRHIEVIAKRHIVTVVRSSTIDTMPYTRVPMPTCTLMNDAVPLPI